MKLKLTQAFYFYNVCYKVVDQQTIRARNYAGTNKNRPKNAPSPSLSGVPYNIALNAFRHATMLPF